MNVMNRDIKLSACNFTVGSWVRVRAPVCVFLSPSAFLSVSVTSSRMCASFICAYARLHDWIPPQPFSCALYIYTGSCEANRERVRGPMSLWRFITRLRCGRPCSSV